jgi:heme exporter protein A
MRETPTKSGPLLRVRGVGKTFVARPVLREVSLAVAPQETVCLCGINGAGKSTLLRISGGLLRPDRGAVTIDGYDVGRDAEAAKRRLGMISHAGMVYPELTVSENLLFAVRLYGVSGGAARVESLLAATGLESFRHDRAGILSRGLLQRLAIARALVHGPRVLLADEPFTGLDGGAAERLLALFDDFVRRGGAILMTTHDLRLGLRCCRRVAVLDRGTLLLDAPKDQIDATRFAEDYLSYARNLQRPLTYGGGAANPAAVSEGGSSPGQRDAASKITDSVPGQTPDTLITEEQGQDALATQGLGRAPAPPNVATTAEPRSALAGLCGLHAILTKDLVVELRARQVLPTMVVLGMLLVFILRLASQSVSGAIGAPVMGAAALWIAFLFSGLLAQERSFAAEQQNNCVDGLLLAPLDAGMIYLAKLLVNVIMLTVFEAVIVPLVLISFHLPVAGGAWRLLAVLMLGNLGISSVGTLFSAAVQLARTRGSLLSIVVLVILMPMMIPATFALLVLFGALPETVAGTGSFALVGSFQAALGYLVVFDAVFVVACWLLFEYIIYD